jgi:hypothetical protein
VLTRLRLDERTRRYVAHRTTEGVSQRRSFAAYNARSPASSTEPWSVDPVLVVLAGSKTGAGESTLKRRRRAQRG